MANRHRGEVEAVIGGTGMRLCLTLGALAELEDVYGGIDLLQLAERFEGGRLRALDVTRIIGAGLRGAGHGISDDELAGMSVEGGIAGAVQVVSQLLRATFADERVSG